MTKSRVDPKGIHLAFRLHLPHKYLIFLKWNCCKGGKYGQVGLFERTGVGYRSFVPEAWCWLAHHRMRPCCTARHISAGTSCSRNPRNSAAKGQSGTHRRAATGNPADHQLRDISSTDISMTLVQYIHRVIGCAAEGADEFHEWSHRLCSYYFQRTLNFRYYLLQL